MINKIIVMHLVLVNFIFANYLDLGIYKASNCDIKISILKENNKYMYKIYSDKIYKGEILFNEDIMTFKDFYIKYYETIEFSKKNLEEMYNQKQCTQFMIDTNNVFSIQNYGNTMNPFVIFDNCGKFLEFQLLSKNIISFNIQTQKQPLYKEPNENTKTKMYLIKNDVVEIIEEKDDWIYILYITKDNKEIKAWIPKNALINE